VPRVVLVVLAVALVLLEAHLNVLAVRVHRDGRQAVAVGAHQGLVVEGGLSRLVHSGLSLVHVGQHALAGGRSRL